MAGALNGKVALVGCYSPRPDEESRHSSAGRATDGLRDRTHTRSQRSEMELLAANSHSAQVADLRFCPTVALTRPVCPDTERATSGSLRDRLEECDTAERQTSLFTLAGDGQGIRQPCQRGP